MCYFTFWLLLPKRVCYHFGSYEWGYTCYHTSL
nr:MAG TPA: hypothetical protein [Caudoviricetes sp.]